MIDIMMKWQAKVQKGKATRPCANMWHTCIYGVLLKQMDRNQVRINTDNVLQRMLNIDLKTKREGLDRVKVARRMFQRTKRK